MKIIIIICLASITFTGISQEQKQNVDSAMNKQYLGLRTCVYHVADLNAAKKWYAEAFDTDPYFDEPFYVGFNIGGFELGLLPEEGEPTPKSDNVVAYWGVEDIKAVYDKLISVGATVHEEPRNVGGPLEVASVRDPWDNVIGIIYNPVFKIEE